MDSPKGSTLEIETERIIYKMRDALNSDPVSLIPTFSLSLLVVASVYSQSLFRLYLALGFVYGSV